MGVKGNTFTDVRETVFRLLKIKNALLNPTYSVAKKSFAVSLNVTLFILILNFKNFFFLFQNFQKSCGAHSAKYSMGTGFFPRVKAVVRACTYSPPRSTNVRNDLFNTSTSLVCLHGLGRDTFALNFYALKS
jgi:hypothetical protein